MHGELFISIAGFDNICAVCSMTFSLHKMNFVCTCCNVLKKNPTTEKVQWSRLQAPQFLFVQNAEKEITLMENLSGKTA